MPSLQSPAQAPLPMSCSPPLTPSHSPMSLSPATPPLNYSPSNSPTFTSCRGSSSLGVCSLDHRTFVCPNLEAAATFYSKFMGFEVSPRPDLGVPGFWLARHDVPFKIHLVEGKGSGAKRPQSSLSFSVDTNELSLREFLLQSCGVVYRKLQVSKELVQLQFCDPMRNSVVLFSKLESPSTLIDQPNRAFARTQLSCEHFVFFCKNLEKSASFYCNLLDFYVLKCGLNMLLLAHHAFNVQILLTGGHSSKTSSSRPIVALDDHVSFNVSSLTTSEEILQRENIPYKKVVFEGLGLMQLFFHDPDGNMIELCNCSELKL